MPSCWEPSLALPRWATLKWCSMCSVRWTTALPRVRLPHASCSVVSRCSSCSVYALSTKPLMAEHPPVLLVQRPMYWYRTVVCATTTEPFVPTLLAMLFMSRSCKLPLLELLLLSVPRCTLIPATIPSMASRCLVAIFSIRTNSLSSPIWTSPPLPLTS